MHVLGSQRDFSLSKMAAGVASGLDELLAQLDQKGSMDWRYLASQFPLTAEEVHSLGAQPSPARALMDALRTKGVQLQEIAETCRRSGLKSAGSVIETYSQRVDARGGRTHERAEAKDVACQEWPGERSGHCISCNSMYTVHMLRVKCGRVTGAATLYRSLG